MGKLEHFPPLEECQSLWYPLHYVTHFKHPAPARNWLRETRLPTGCKCMGSAIQQASTSVNQTGQYRKVFVLTRTTVTFQTTLY